MKKVIRFTATWCGPCQVFSKTFKKVADDMKEVEFEVIDISLGSTLVKKYDIRNIPATLVFDGDKPYKKHIGIMSEEELRNFILE